MEVGVGMRVKVEAKRSERGSLFVCHFVSRFLSFFLWSCIFGFILSGNDGTCGTHYDTGISHNTIFYLPIDTGIDIRCSRTKQAIRVSSNPIPFN